jgi:hypothetical protein
MNFWTSELRIFDLACLVSEFLSFFEFFLSFFLC